MRGDFLEVPLLQPELVRLVCEPAVGDAAVESKYPVRHAKVAEPDANWKHGNCVP